MPHKRHSVERFIDGFRPMFGQGTASQAAAKVGFRIRVRLQAYLKPLKMVLALAAAGSGETSIRASYGKGMASAVPPRASKDAGFSP
jgi:hypothetical protein